jgi:hypothetical protein
MANNALIVDVMRQMRKEQKMLSVEQQELLDRQQAEIEKLRAKQAQIRQKHLAQKQQEENQLMKDSSLSHQLVSDGASTSRPPPETKRFSPLALFFGKGKMDSDEKQNTEELNASIQLEQYILTELNQRKAQIEIQWNQQMNTLDLKKENLLALLKLERKFLKEEQQLEVKHVR